MKRVVHLCPLERLGQTEDVAPLVGLLGGDSGSGSIYR